MVGRINSIRLRFDTFLLSERNRAPITGMSPSSGTLSAVSVTVLSSSPPTTTVSPLPTSTALFTVRVLKVAPRSLLVLEAESATLDTSCSISSSTASPSLICGFTFSLMPTVLRSTVLKMLSPEVVCEPVNTGTSWPTLKVACILSRVTMLGVARISFLVLLERAVSSIAQFP